MAATSPDQFSCDSVTPERSRLMASWGKGRVIFGNYQALQGGVPTTFQEMGILTWLLFCNHGKLIRFDNPHA